MSTRAWKLAGGVALIALSVGLFVAGFVRQRSITGVVAAAFSWGAFLVWSSSRPVDRNED
ncbi:hypothetical protein [Austwickia sp. TVS 96-490-7B]|uniref:hypothetical protein n=1 Tax=Austwickia sp. TVS 96-490-7B TaxID=2830843 RepID=UPI001C55D353|nr:hypothetical protein [Austwickia sp. TVS 96-490-7B]